MNWFQWSRVLAPERVALAMVMAAFARATAAPAPAPDQILEGKMQSLGRRDAAEKSGEPRFDLRFEAAPGARENSVRLTHRGVMQPWSVELNGRRVGSVPPSYRGPERAWFDVPPGIVTNGVNVLSVVGEDFGREISVGEIALFHRPLRELLKLRRVTVAVKDADSGAPVPARISILDGDSRAEIFNISATNVAVRPGVIYTDGREVMLEIPEGRYRFLATRGMEWSLGQKEIAIPANDSTRVDLRIRRQVDTRGFIAADTHIHTVTFSGHGDATISERMVTIAGEGVELAVATDHNHQTDYARYQSRQGLTSHFTPVTGNEVTTRNGHFIAWPMPLKGPLPDHTESDWVKLVADMRFKGAQAVIWNHPQFPGPDKSPMKLFNFNRASGDRFAGPPFNFDAMEIANSSTPAPIGRVEENGPSRQLFSEWFAILNRGERITGVGSSDSHTVEAPVGQGRTYIRSSTDDATKANVDELVRNFLRGDTSVSYGIFADVTVQGRAMGDTLSATGKTEVTLRIAAPDWVKPRRALVFLNGLPVAEQSLHPRDGQPFDERIKFSVTLPKHDVHLVCAAFGDGIKLPFWRTLSDDTAAITNPVFIDADGDGKYQSPRATAERRLAATDGGVNSAWQLVEQSDDALAAQMLGLIYLNRDAGFVKEFDARVAAAAAKRPLYQTFLANSPLITVKAASAKEPARARGAAAD